MMLKRFISALLSCFVITSAGTGCSSGDDGGLFDNVNHLGVDSTNDRLFVVEPDGVLYALTASTAAPIAAHPLVDESVNSAISDLLPSVVSHLAVVSNGSLSRLFIMGAFDDGAGDLALNLVRVLDFDGAAFTQSAFSPIVLSDGDAATDESDDSFAELKADAATGIIYVSDASRGRVFTVDAATGVQGATLTIAGEPQGLSLDGGRLYVCNSSDNDTEQVVTVVNLADATTTGIDLGVPCSSIAVKSNSSGTVLIAKRYNAQRLLIHRVDTTTFASSSEIASTTSGIANGSLSAGAGISSGINDIVIGASSGGVIHAYVSQEDGNIEQITFVAELSSYALTTLSAAAENITRGAIFTTGDGSGAEVFFVAESGYLVSIVFGSSDVDLEN